MHALCFHGVHMEIVIHYDVLLQAWFCKIENIFSFELLGSDTLNERKFIVLSFDSAEVKGVVSLRPVNGQDYPASPASHFTSNLLSQFSDVASFYRSLNH